MATVMITYVRCLQNFLMRVVAGAVGPSLLRSNLSLEHHRNRLPAVWHCSGLFEQGLPPTL